MELTVECKKREEGSKPNALRRSGLIPAVLYGHDGTESTNLTLEAKTAEKLVQQASLNNTQIQLNVTDMGWSGKTLLREVQAHPWRGKLYHLSFFAIAAHGNLEVAVPLHFVGQAVGVKTGGGMLDPVITEIQVRCAPDSIPDGINIDVSGLEIGDSLQAHQLSLPPGVTALIEPGQTVVTVLAPRMTDEGTTTEAATST